MASTLIPTETISKVVYSVQAPFTTEDEFTFSFPYFDKEDVIIQINSQIQLEADDFEFESDYLIRLTQTGVDRLNAIYTETTVTYSFIIARQTPLNSRRVDFQNGSLLTEEILDENSDQLLYILQEAYDTFNGSALVIDPNNGSVDLGDGELTNVGEPNQLTSVATLGTVINYRAISVYEEGKVIRPNTIVEHEGELYLSIVDMEPTPETFDPLSFIPLTDRMLQVQLNKSDISALDSRVGYVETDVMNVTSIANTNDIRSRANETDIQTNQTDIATNATDIATNVTNIATNTSDIATNTASVGTLDARVTTNTNELSNQNDRINDVDADLVNLDDRLVVIETDLPVVQTNVATVTSDLSAHIDDTLGHMKVDTKSKLDSYASSGVPNGTTVFASDTKKRYQVIDGVLQPIGSGSGTSSEALYYEDFSSSTPTELYGTGGTGTNGTGLLIENNTVAPLANSVDMRLVFSSSADTGITVYTVEDIVVPTYVQELAVSFDVKNDSSSEFLAIVTPAGDEFTVLSAEVIKTISDTVTIVVDTSSVKNVSLGFRGYNIITNGDSMQVSRISIEENIVEDTVSLSRQFYFEDFSEDLPTTLLGTGSLSSVAIKDNTVDPISGTVDAEIYIAGSAANNSRTYLINGEPVPTGTKDSVVTFDFKKTGNTVWQSVLLDNSNQLHTIEITETEGTFEHPFSGDDMSTIRHFIRCDAFDIYGDKIQVTNISVGVANVIDDLYSKTAALETDVAALQSDVATLNSDVSTNTTDIQTTQASVALLNSDVSINTADIATANTNISNNSAWIGSVSGDVDDLDDSVTAHTINYNAHIRVASKASLTSWATLSTVPNGAVGFSSDTKERFQVIDNVLAPIGAGSSGLDYRGSWDPSTNTPTLPLGDESSGTYFIASTTGTTNIDGISDWSQGDWIIYNGSTYDKIDNSDKISSVNGEIGTVQLGFQEIWDKTNGVVTNKNGATFDVVRHPTQMGLNTRTMTVKDVSNNVIFGVGYESTELRKVDFYNSSSPYPTRLEANSTGALEVNPDIGETFALTARGRSKYWFCQNFDAADHTAFSTAIGFDGSDTVNNSSIEGVRSAKYTLNASIQDNHKITTINSLSYKSYMKKVDIEMVVRITGTAQFASQTELNGTVLDTKLINITEGEFVHRITRGTENAIQHRIVYIGGGSVGDSIEIGRVLVGDTPLFVAPITGMLKHVEPYQVDGGSQAQQAWTRRPLNTEYGDFSQFGTLLPDGSFTLDAGVYQITAQFQHFAGSRVTSRIHDVTNDTPVAESIPMRIGSYGRMTTCESVDIVVTTDGTVFSAESYTQLAQANDGIGRDTVPQGLTEEIYTSVKIVKIG